MLVVPSHGEGMPLAMMEAMAAGLPVVAMAVGAIPELVRHRETGLLVGPGAAGSLASAVDDLLATPAWAAALGASARDEALERRPQHETAMRVGEPLAPVSSSAARMRLAARTADAAHDP